MNIKEKKSYYLAVKKLKSQVLGVLSPCGTLKMASKNIQNLILGPANVPSYGGKRSL